MSETAEATIDPAVMEDGRQQFMICQACHGPTGLGTNMIAPPLAGSEWVNGPPENLIRIQLRGLQGPIKVNGKEYTFVAGMPPQFFQSDDQIAHVLTFVRNSFGNKAPEVAPARVASLRSEVGKPQLSVADLIPPAPKAEAETAMATPKAPAHAEPNAQAAQTTTQAPAQAPPPPSGNDSAPPPLALPFWTWLLALVWIALCLLPVLRRK